MTHHLKKNFHSEKSDQAPLRPHYLNLFVPHCSDGHNIVGPLDMMVIEYIMHFNSKHRLTTSYNPHMPGIGITGEGLCRDLTNNVQLIKIKCDGETDTKCY